MFLRLWAIVLALLLSIPAQAGEERLVISLVNQGPGALRCQWQLAHWMTADALALPTGGEATLTVWREDSGALFLRQGEEPRPFHIEALLCGLEQGFGQTRQQVDLSALRRDRAGGLTVTCSNSARSECIATPVQ